MTAKKVQDRITPSIQRIQRELDQVPAQALDVWVQNTPRDTGNAQRRTRLRGNQILADYDYAVPLDRGHSPKSPQGMSAPTERFLRNRVREILRKR